jgi:pantothenate kinase
VAGAIAVEPSARLVVVEGNYLLVDEDPWARLRAELDEAWFCATPGGERFARLVDRHTTGGRAPDAAAAWAREVDGANAALIEGTRGRADLVVDGTAAGVPAAVPGGSGG